MSRVDWPALRAAAVEVMRRAYAPYSNFPVGAAGLVDDGRVVVGCNVENAAYGVVLCAECGMVSQLHATGGGRLIAMACVGGDGEPLLPCGRCRQLLWENGGPAMLVDSKAGPLTMDYLLPLGFGQEDLAAVATASRDSALDEPEPDDDRPKRPPSRNVKKQAAEPVEQEQPKARAAKKLTLRDLDAEEPETDAPPGRKLGGRTSKAAPALTAKAPSAKVVTSAADAAPARAASGGVASDGAAKSGAAKGGAASGGAAKGGAAAGGVASGGAAKGGAAAGGAVSGGAVKSGAAAKGGAAKGGGVKGGAGAKGGAAKGGAAGLGAVEEESAGRQGRAGVGKARGKGAAR